jgi:hypothetical protein
LKKVLVVQYSQSGQLTDVVAQIVGPLREAAGVEVIVETVRPVSPYPFPWPVLRFFDTFPEAVYLDPPALQAFQVDPAERFDLVILGYQAWFLSPSLPITGFLQSETGRRLLADTPVVTVVACRDMWLMAQEQVRGLLAACGARLVGHVALVDEAGSIGSFLATPFWVWTGNRGPRLWGLIPRAGVNPREIAASPALWGADRLGAGGGQAPGRDPAAGPGCGPGQRAPDRQRARHPPGIPPLGPPAAFPGSPGGPWRANPCSCSTLCGWWR